MKFKVPDSEFKVSGLKSRKRESNSKLGWKALSINFQAIRVKVEPRGLGLGVKGLW